MSILNLTQHNATPDQISAGVVAMDEKTTAPVRRLLTVETMPCREEVQDRAYQIAQLVKDYVTEGRLFDSAGGIRVMIGGAPWLMSSLEEELQKCGFSVLYAFSVRESIDVVGDDGSVKKTGVFRHAGFVPAKVRYKPD